MSRKVEILWIYNIIYDLFYSLKVNLHVHALLLYTRTKSFWKKQFGFRDETGVKSTETRWATVRFMRHTCTLNISYLNKYCIICIYNTYLGKIYSVCLFRQDIFSVLI